MPLLFILFYLFDSVNQSHVDDIISLQNDAAALGSVPGRHQLLRPRALPLAAGDAHPGRLHQLHTHCEGGAAVGHPVQASVPQPQHRRQLRWLQQRPGLRASRPRGRGQKRGQ